MLTAITDWERALTQHTDLDRSTVTQYVGDVQRFVTWFRTDKWGASFADISVQDAKDYRDALVTARRAPATARRADRHGTAPVRGRHGALIATLYQYGMLAALALSALMGCDSSPVETPTPLPPRPPLPTPTPVRDLPPNSNGTMALANLRGTGAYAGPAMLNPGAVLWHFGVDIRPRTTAPPVPVYGRSGSTPAVVQDRVYIGGDESLYALDAVTGQEQWRFNTPRGIVNSPAVAGDLVYFASGDSTLYAVARTAGRLVWRFPRTPAVPTESIKKSGVSGR